MEKTLKKNKFFYSFLAEGILSLVFRDIYKYELSKGETSTTVDTDNKKSLFIGTQEKFLELALHIFIEIDLFVIDEAYKLEENVHNQRGYKLSETFLQSIDRKSKKIILPSPQAKFKGFERYEFSTFESNFNAVEKIFTVLEPLDLYDTLLRRILKEKSILFCKSPQQINSTFDKLEKRLVPIEYNKAFIKLLL